MSKELFTILVVDDEASILDFTCKVLEASGYRTLRAQHSDEALILLDGFKGVVHLLLTDVKMDPFILTELWREYWIDFKRKREVERRKNENKKRRETQEDRGDCKRYKNNKSDPNLI